MAKIGDSYILPHPWKIIERGFHPGKSRVSESLFALANERIGVRGSFDEGYSGDTLPGFYASGIHEEHALREPLGYKGIPDRIRFMVNTVDWLHVRIECDGEILDLRSSVHEDFLRELDFRTGLLTRRFIWRTRSGHRIVCAFDRLLGMHDRSVAAQRMTFRSVGSTCRLELTLGLDFSLPHESYKECFWRCPRRVVGEKTAMLGQSTQLAYSLFAGFVVHSSVHGEWASRESESFAGRTIVFPLRDGREESVEKICVLHHPLHDDAWETGMAMLERHSSSSFASLRDQNTEHWRTVWEAADIGIEGDLESQQGIRFCIFHLQQTCGGALEGSQIGAKGLTGEAYNGHTFWDTEIYCLPHFLFTNPSAARALIDFRFSTLSQAVDRAHELGCLGASFPVATIDGTESCTLWQHANLQLQPTTAVAYAVRHYCTVTGDDEYLFDRGIELLVQICRFLASRGQWSSRGRRFGFYGVMGPDEFHMMVNNNAYTNIMARETFLFTERSISRMQERRPDSCAALMDRLGCTESDRRSWAAMADTMIVPLDPDTGVFEQHEGYFGLPHVEISTLPPEEFPLYAHWSYDRIFRYDMIKQPDVLMFLFLFNRDYSLAQKRANFDYYEPRCIHESSLSPSVHSILAAELGLKATAMELFRFATRIDLDNYNRNTAEGLHMTSLAAAWMNVVYGFGGMRSDGDVLHFAPTIPDGWESYSFSVVYRGSALKVEVSPAGAVIRRVDGPACTVSVCGVPREVSREGISAPARHSV